MSEGAFYLSIKFSGRLIFFFFVKGFVKGLEIIYISAPWGGGEERKISTGKNDREEN